MQQFTLSFTMDDINYLGSVLQEQPFKEVAGFLGKINQQMAAQTQRAPVPPAPPAPVLPDAAEVLPVA